jgi:glycosyltransferase involved in cell wall biosynthesis
VFFSFLNYISPTWYFNLLPESRFPGYCVDYDALNEDEKKVIDLDNSYSSSGVSKLDAAYQAWHKGIIKSDPKYNLISGGIIPSLNDEYYFTRKYFKSFWPVYILFLRLLTFHNPFKELKAFFNSRKSERVNIYDRIYNFTEYSGFQSPLVKSNPFISIIIPTLNRYKYLDDVLKDLEAQEYKNFEVIIIDQSKPYEESFYKNRDLNLNVIRQEETALWLARNKGIKLAKGEYLLFYDDDSRIEKDWIIQHLKTLNFFDADISSGVSLSVVGSAVPFNYSFFRWSDQIDTGNFLIKKEIFYKTGLFDRQFEKQRMGDGEFGLRCYLKGFKNISNPYAKRIHLKVSEGGLRQMGSWDAFRPRKLFSPRPIPSVNYFTRKYFGTTNAVYNLLLNVPPSVIPYRFKRSRLKKAFGSILFILFIPVLLIPVIISWRRATVMLFKRDKIEYLD